MTAWRRFERWAHRLPLPVKIVGRRAEQLIRQVAQRIRRPYELAKLARTITPSSPAVLEWWADGCEPPPPNERKRQLLHELACHHRPRAAVETGTFVGDTTAFLANRCARVITIELDPGLAARARDRFRALPHVVVLEGDSAELLPGVLAELDEPALFWLDGHFSGCHEGVMTARGSRDTPLPAELRAITDWPHAADSVIVVDDARLLGTGDYPSVDEIRAQVRALHDCSISIACDALIIQPFRGSPPHL